MTDDHLKLRLTLEASKLRLEVYAGLLDTLGKAHAAPEVLAKVQTMIEEEQAETRRLQDEMTRLRGS